MNNVEISRQALIEEITKKPPDFVQAVKHKDANIIILHQDAFAADYQEEEYLLLGKAIKYAGIFGKEVHFQGVNRETLK